MSPFRHRGLRVHVDTCLAAEFDAKSYQIPDPILGRIAQNLKAVPFSDRDRRLKTFRVREVLNFDVVFFLTKETDSLVVNIVALHPFRPEAPLAKRMRMLRPIATLRSAFGT